MAKITRLEQVLKLVDQLSPDDLLELRRKLELKNLTWANAELQDLSERDTLFKREEGKAGERVKESFESLQRLGILDEKGYLIEQRLPADMDPGSNCDVGG